MLTSALAAKNMAIGPANNEPERVPVFDLIHRVRGESEMLLLDVEAYNIYSGVKRTRKIPGAIAEVGVFKGGSARLICEIKGDCELHLFDTFEGLADSSSDDQFANRQFVSSFDSVRRYLSTFPNVHLHKGLFPATATPIENLRFSFVHLDVDTHNSTCAGLEFFYPRLNPGGLLISHDYMWVEGVRRAFDNFFAAKPEPLLEIGGSQCAFVKL
jgi:hypothetical protein